MRRGLAAIGAFALLLSGCQGSSGDAAPSTPATSSAPAATSTAPVPTPDPSTNTPSSSSASSSTVRSSAPSRSSSTPAPVTSSRAVPIGPKPARKPVIVLDPGHSPGITATDPKTGLSVSDYENDPEMRDVFAVALLVRAKLQAAGYRVVLTRAHVTDRASLAARAAVANRVHADLALSIHDQAGANGGLPFAGANNIVYYQSVGTYRATPAGKRIYFTDKALAALSKRYGTIFQAERSRLEHHSVRLQGNTGYDLGSRGLAAGNIWIVQLLSTVPWIYNEAGGNSAGQVGLDAADKQRYAAGLVASVERCVPIR